MKNIKTFLILLALVLMTACGKEDIPMTSTVDLAGEWMVTADIADGDKVYEDPYGIGQMLFITYNTNADNGKEMWLDDLGNFWGTKVKIPCETAGLTFGSSTPVLNSDYDEIEVTVTKGKVVPGGTTSPSGMPADYIEFYIEYEDDPGTLYYIHGYRRTGFVADE